MHSTREVQCDRYSADSDFAASASVLGGRYCSIGGRASRSDCSMFSSPGAMNASSSVVFVDVTSMLSIVERSGWLYRLCVRLDVLPSFVLLPVSGKGAMGCEGGADETALGLLAADTLLLIVRLI